MTVELFPATIMPDGEWWSRLWPNPEAVLRKLGVKPGMTALDLCCGDGWFTAPLARITGGKLYALDADPGMVEQARERLEQAGATALDLICAAPRDLPLVLPQPVNFVLLANALHGVPDPTAMARTIASVLKPGSHVAVIEWRPIPREETTVQGKPRGPRSALRMSPEEVEDALYAGDLYLGEVIDLPPYHYGAVFWFNGPKPEAVKAMERVFEAGNVDPDIYVFEDTDVPVEQQRAEAEAMLRERQDEYWSWNTPDMLERAGVLPEEHDED